MSTDTERRLREALLRRVEGLSQLAGEAETLSKLAREQIGATEAALGLPAGSRALLEACLRLAELDYLPSMGETMGEEIGADDEVVALIRGLAVDLPVRGEGR